MESNDSVVAVLYSTNEPDVGAASPGSQQLRMSVLLMDVDRMTALRVAEDLLPGGSISNDLMFSSNGALMVTVHNCSLYSVSLGCPVGQLASHDVHFCGFALKDSVYILSQGQFLHAFCLPEGTQIGKVNRSKCDINITSRSECLVSCFHQVNVHETIRCVTKASDDRTIIVGCDSGNVHAYTLINCAKDDVERVVETISSRGAQAKDRTRSWDRLVNDNVDGNYSRPPSIATAQSKTCDLDNAALESLGPISSATLTGVRPRTCCLM